jgi:hypothetical protein
MTVRWEIARKKKSLLSEVNEPRYRSTKLSSASLEHGRANAQKSIGCRKSETNIR